MKTRIVSIALLLTVALAETAVAGPKDLVAEFLKRYQPAPVRLPAMPSSGNALGDRVRGGELPLTVADLVDLVLRNNLDIGINRLAPFSLELCLPLFNA